MTPTADTWLARGPDGKLEPIKVVDMTDEHLVRWVRYFRQKFIDRGAVNNDFADAGIIQSMVTAPAIYDEIGRRNLWYHANKPTPIIGKKSAFVAGGTITRQLAASFNPAAFSPPATIEKPGPKPDRLITFEDEV
jgi:hypothetical protein